MEIFSKKLLLGGKGDSSGRFVIVQQDSNKCVYSDDGIQWSTATLPDSTNWFSVGYGKGKFVAFASNGTYNYFANSPNGSSWTKKQLPGAIYTAHSVKFGNNKFVALGISRTNTSSNPPVYVCLQSTDGDTWSAVTPSTSGPFMELHFENGIFYTAGMRSGVIYYSTDGTNWSTINGGGDSTSLSIVYGKNKWVAAFPGSFSGPEFATSTDGVNFTGVTGIPGTIYGLTFGKNKFVGRGYATVSGASRQCIFNSNDGVNWNVAYIFPAGTPNIRFVKYGNGVFVVHAWDNAALDTFYYSSDGINWNTGTLPIAIKSNDITIGG